MSNAAQARPVEEMNWPEVIESAKEKFLEVKPGKMEFTAERAFAIQLLQNNTYLKQVAMANPGSLQAAMMNVAAIGLSLNPAKKQAYLIPRSVKIGKEYVTKIFLEPSYMGLCDLATMSGSIKWIQANVVYANDKFLDNGPGHAPTHEYSAFAKPVERGEFVGAYCVAKTEGGDFLTTTMSAAEINSIKMRSELGKDGKGPWQNDFNEQAKKTVVRRGFKMWPKTDTLDRMAMAIEISNSNEGFEPILSAPALGQYTADQKKYFDQLITKADAIELFLFNQSLDESVRNNLFNSFEKGTITKYKQVVRDLESKGFAMLRDVAEAVDGRASNGDDMGLMGELEGLSPEAVEYVSGKVSDEAARMIREGVAQ